MSSLHIYPYVAIIIYRSNRQSNSVSPVAIHNNKKDCRCKKKENSKTQIITSIIITLVATTIIVTDY